MSLYKWEFIDWDLGDRELAVGSGENKLLRSKRKKISHPSGVFADKKIPNFGNTSVLLLFPKILSVEVVKLDHVEKITAGRFHKIEFESPKITWNYNLLPFRTSKITMRGRKSMILQLIKTILQAFWRIGQRWQSGNGCFGRNSVFYPRNYYYSQFWSFQPIKITDNG